MGKAFDLWEAAHEHSPILFGIAYALFITSMVYSFIQAGSPFQVTAIGGVLDVAGFGVLIAAIVKYYRAPPMQDTQLDEPNEYRF